MGTNVHISIEQNFSCAVWSQNSQNWMLNVWFGYPCITVAWPPWSQLYCGRTLQPRASAGITADFRSFIWVPMHYICIVTFPRTDRVASTLLQQSPLVFLRYPCITSAQSPFNPNYVTTEPGSLVWVPYVCTATHLSTDAVASLTLLQQSLTALSECPCIISAQPPIQVLTS